jgi:hypothetical protein
VPVDFQRRAIFIHIPRTGGTSIEEVLHLRKASNYYGFIPQQDLVPNSKTPQHFTYLELMRNLPSDFFADASFVRNPWDRFVSEFKWRQTRFRRAVRAGHVLSDKRYLNSLRDFVEVLELPSAARTDATVGFDGHLETQTGFLIDAGGCISVDFVGSFENYDAHLKKVLSRLGVPPTVLHLNRTLPSDYRSHYDDYTRCAVGTFYAEDIKNFGYKF